MPTQRPFLSNFLAAFRAHQHPQLPKAAPSISASTAAGQTLWTSSSAATSATTSTSPRLATADTTLASPRPINPKTNPSTSSSTPPPAATTNLPSDRHQQQFLQHNVSPATHLPRSPPSPGLIHPSYGPPNRPSASSPVSSTSASSATPTSPPSYPTPQDTQPWGRSSSTSRNANRRGSGRRGSDSSADSAGFREVRPPAGEKWFIGGRTAAGEERFYALAQIRRERSSDRVSTDRLSL